MSKVIKYMPELEGDEQLFAARLMKYMTDEQAEQFARVYRQRRKDPTVTLLTALLGFFGIAGVDRFYLNQIGMGVLYLLTFGLCFIGTIVDLITHQKLTYAYNQRQAEDVATLIRGVFPEDDAEGDDAERRSLSP